MFLIVMANWVRAASSESIREDINATVILNVHQVLAVTLWPCVLIIWEKHIRNRCQVSNSLSRVLRRMKCWDGLADWLASETGKCYGSSFAHAGTRALLMSADVLTRLSNR
jgi:hypothetical protein